MKVYVCSWDGEDQCAFIKKEDARNWLIDQLEYTMSKEDFEYRFLDDDYCSCVDNWSLEDLVKLALDYNYYVEEFEIEDKPEPVKVNAPTYVMMDPEPNVTGSSIKQALQQVKEAIAEEVYNAVRDNLNKIEPDKAERVKQTIGTSEKDSRVRHL